MDKYHTIRGICQGTGLLSGYLGKVPVPQIREVILMQILWIAVLLIVESMVWYGARRKVIVQGG